MTPEQVIGNVWLSVLRLKRAGLRVHTRAQLIGAAVVGSLRDNGFTVVETRHLRVIEDGNDQMDAELVQLKKRLAKVEACEWEMRRELELARARVAELEVHARVVPGDL